MKCAGKSLLRASIAIALASWGAQASAVECQGLKWTPEQVFQKGDVTYHNGHQYHAAWWVQGAEPVLTGGKGDWILDTACTAPTQGGASHKPMPTEPSSELYCSYKPISETADTFKGEVKLANPNPGYAWNGSWFNVLDVSFASDNTITAATSPGGNIAFSHAAGRIAFDPGWQRFFDPNKVVTFSVEGKKGANGQADLGACKPNYAHAEDIRYPAYAGLPATWHKGKPDLTAADLIADPVSYYASQIPAVTDSMIMYTPPNPTQISLGLVERMNYVVNTTANVRIFMPNPYLAMGIAFAHQHQKFNPNYLCALGTKENYTCGAVPVADDTGAAGLPVTLDGIDYIWPIVPAHGDGPFQTEAGNFGDMAQVFPDWFSATATHRDFVTASADMKHPNWIRSAITAALSLTVTREHVNSVPGARLNAFLDNATDKWAEFAMLTFAYNRGAGMFFSKEILSTNRTQALASTNIAQDFGMSGFASHNETIRAITEAMNNSKDIYDANLTLEDIKAFTQALRAFYAQGTPTDAEWAAMEADVENAFMVLAQHWGGAHVSYRHDFLTLLRVMEAYLPSPKQPRPTGSHWYYISQNVTL